MNHHNSCGIRNSVYTGNNPNFMNGYHGRPYKCIDCSRYSRFKFANGEFYILDNLLHPYLEVFVLIHYYRSNVLNIHAILFNYVCSVILDDHCRSAIGNLVQSLFVLTVYRFEATYNYPWKFQSSLECYEWYVWFR